MNNILRLKKDQKVFFTSDTHFGHNKSFLWGKRGFSCIKDHDDTIIDNINSVVKTDDILFHLGDFCLNSTESDCKSYIQRIKCNNI